MKPDLKKRIKQFNEIKFAKDKSKRVIIATLKPSDVTIGCRLGRVKG